MNQLAGMAAWVALASMIPAAAAQSPDVVTLYGRVFVMVESVEAPGGAVPLVRRTRVTDQSSLIGVRGTEDLGGGLTAWFQLETPFLGEQNNTVFASRNSAVGLRHGLGTVLLGRWDTPFRLGGAIDAFGDLTIAGYGAAMSDRGNYKRREQNVVQYWTPAWAGFDARLHYSANEARTAARNPSVYGASVAYTAVGSVYVGYAYEKHTAVADGVDESGNELGINIRTEHWKIGGLLQEFDRTNASRQKSWLGNLVYNLGKHRLVYQHQYSKGGAGLAAPQPRCTVDSVGYQYNFSRRTYVLVLYTRTDNNDAAACNFGANNLVISAGQDPRGWAMGVRHIF